MTSVGILGSWCALYAYLLMEQLHGSPIAWGAVEHGSWTPTALSLRE